MITEAATIDLGEHAHALPADFDPELALRLAAEQERNREVRIALGREPEPTVDLKGGLL